MNEKNHSASSVATPPDRLEWRKSSYSGAVEGACVEVARSDGGTVGIRDSKNEGMPFITVSPASFAAFVAVAVAS